jgi:hypothetical protein
LSYYICHYDWNFCTPIMKMMIMKMHTLHNKMYLMITLCLLGFLAVGCGGTPVNKTEAATPSNTDLPVATPNINTIPTATSEAGPNGPSGVPVIPNKSLITAKIISITTNDTGTFVELQIIETQSVPGFSNFGVKLVGKQITAKVVDDAGNISSLVGQIITGKLSYNGDEHSGLYLLSEVQKKQ